MIAQAGQTVHLKKLEKDCKTDRKLGLYRLKKGIFRGLLALYRLIYHPGKFWQCCSLNLLHPEGLYLQWCSLRSQISGSDTDTLGICVLLCEHLQQLGTTRPQSGTTRPQGQKRHNPLSQNDTPPLYKKVDTLKAQLSKKVDSVSHETILLHSKKAQKNILLLYRHLVAYPPCVECSAIPLHKKQCALGLQRHWAIALAFFAPRT